MATAAKAQSTANGIEKSVKNAKAEGDSDDIKLQLSILQEDVAELTKAMQSYGKARGSQARLAAEQTANDIKDRANQLGKDAEAQLRSGYASAETAVKDNPAAAVGIAAGVGFLLGLLTVRR
ncbi:glycine zipper domain-containing protein [Pseudooceanicola sp. MF1-13]|uniref:glycine zipper domain-containing protein n=1 Tax=Pseudooceanicola sp. MF1-13 TaxID=3379095 RepID=UPI0038926196